MRSYSIEQFGLENLRLINEPEPTPNANEILVRVRAVSLNYRDLMVVSGTYNPRMPLPAVPGSDCAGEVVAVGDDVEEWRVGDRVCSTVIPGWIGGGPSQEASKTAIGAGGARGVLSEYAVFHETAVVRAPKHLSYEEASTLPCAGLTAWHALSVSGKLREAETVLTLGTGGVSVFALQFAKQLGARVIIASSSDEKLERARELGADETVNYRETEDWDRKVLDLTGGLGVDHVVEVGGAGTLSRSVKSVQFGGHIALIGALAAAGDFNLIPVFMKGIRMQGIFVGSREMFTEMNEFIEKADLKPVIDRQFGFDELKAALEEMRNGSHFGKIVVTVT
jgi:2-desacetyl-2-hydroxyethyl bacteriochlorophyllide A dehydrogenase